MSKAVIVNNLTKDYLILDTPGQVIRTLLGGKRKYYRALDNISFEVEEGEAIALIGANGAGKSTILKILSGVMKDYKGEVDIKGKVSAILEVTTSFSPYLSGRDNVYRHLLLQGISKKQISSIEKDIIEFSELNNIINQPIFTYSRGMIAKLAFAVATAHINEIFLIDELLVVGDEYFQGKCFQRIKEICSSGRTAIIASHNIFYIERLCKRAIWLDKGKIKAIGPTQDVIMAYLGKDAGSVDSTYPRQVACIKSVQVESGNNKLYISVVVKRIKPDPSLNCQLYIHDSRRGLIAGLVNTGWRNIKIPEGTGPVRISSSIPVPQGLQSGIVSVVVFRGGINTWDGVIEDAWGWDNSKQVYFGMNKEKSSNHIPYIQIPIRWSYEHQIK
ncbi:MAG: ABC transporter ATP-binding protein [Peptococcaceae bacterium]|jgi:ABC-type polysaccharide/polyol phosphate transport system ATPase subunit|nr:ABC transporter ATP-binding protein [Peptococcaceae bacterium]